MTRTEENTVYRPPNGQSFLKVEAVSKSFPGVKALNRVSLEVANGEVLALIGENGAGKGTLIKIIGGIHEPDSGRLIVDGEETNFRSVQDSIQAGVAVIHQELNLAENLSVAENLYLGRQPTLGPFGLRDRRKLLEGSRRALESVGLQVLVETRLSDLSPGQKQLVEIAKALSQNARLLIFDEPTSSLSTHEADVLHERIREFRDRGIAIIYISHRLKEIPLISKQVQVLRDGEMAGFLHDQEITHDNMVRLMVGRDISKFFSHQRDQAAADRSVVLSVRDLRLANTPHHVSFDLHEGEILGMAGLVGAGRTELVQAIFGATPYEEGAIRVDGEVARVTSPPQALKAGILLVPEDRKNQGLVLELGVGDNIALAGLVKMSRWTLRNRKREAAVASEQRDQLQIRPHDLGVRAKNLSGGNQQKVVLGKWLSMGGRVLILDEPTRGVDVGAKEEIYLLMSKLASQGLGILMVSSEMEELIAMSDRIVVLHEGRLTGELHGDAITEENVLSLAVGGKGP